eukprot:CAMPEP_0184487944 /NCGR_PEP_ID=MMETSP0113_2-20130426/10430_1 /TAXON_ID=91329 /ORGANISM="Norrisiella sphaerica, Strain BC52" /LENGTH=616 /DNA_ID=CAMNT_0026870385 /DNA_START=95 /DNA_END=1942 /DNA_ORIENTATION=+
MGNEISSSKNGSDLVLKEGWLTKRGGWRNDGPKRRRHVKTWKRRYFVLCAEQLNYYGSAKAHKKGSKPMGTLNFNGESAVQDGKDFREMHKDFAGKLDKKYRKKLQTIQTKHELVVCGFEGNLMLRADNQLEKEQWIKIIRKTLAETTQHKSVSFQNLLVSFSLDDGPSHRSKTYPNNRKHRLEVIKDDEEEEEVKGEKREVEMISLQELVERILTAKQRDTGLAGGSWNSFLGNTHTCFASTDEVIKLVLENLCHPPARFTSHKGRFQECAIILLENWFEEIPDDFEGIDHTVFESAKTAVDRTQLMRFIHFVKGIQDLQSSIAVAHLSECSIHSTNTGRSSDYEGDGMVEASSVRSKDRSDEVRRATLHEKKLGHFFKKFAPEIMDIRNYDIDEVCNTLMHVDLNLLKSIHPRSFMKKLWKSKNAGFLCPDLMHAIATWNKRCYWVASAILVDDMGRSGTLPLFAKKTKAFIKRFIAIACQCVKLGNYYCASCILCALKLQCVKRFTPAWDLLKKESRKNMEFLEEACSRKKYWETFEKVQETDSLHIPHLPLVLDALYQIEVKFSKDKDNKINFAKYKKQWQIISTIRSQRNKEFKEAKDEKLVSALSSAVHW